MDEQLCGAITRSGRPCRNIPFADNGRCKFHGGLSTGPRDPSKLKGNKNAAGNRGGGAPKGNKNAAKKNKTQPIQELIIPWGRKKLCIRYIWDGNQQKEISRQII
jgi:hypothetical protein